MAKVFIGTGRRKSSVAQVKMTAGKGKITVNGVDVNEFMPYATYVMDLKQPLVATNNENTFDIEVKVTGGATSVSMQLPTLYKVLIITSTTIVSLAGLAFLVLQILGATGVL